MVAGYDVVREAQQIRSTIGLSGQYAAVDENLTGRENLVMFGRLYQLAGSEAKRRADACSSNSISQMPPIASSRPTQAECGADWTWRAR